MSRVECTRHVARAIPHFLLVFFALDMAVGGEPAAIVRGPWLQALLAESVEIRWTTSELAPTGLWCRSATGAERSFEDAELRIEHRVRLEGLEPGTEHEYVPRVGELPLLEGPAPRFRTAPPTGTGVFRAVALGDSGIPSAAQLAVAARAAELAPDLVLHTGDLFYVSDLDEALFRPFRDLLAGAALFPARGNHDLDLEGGGLEWTTLFSLPGHDPSRERAYYSFDWGPAHVAVLDWYWPIGDDSAQVEFLEADLATARDRGAVWSIVVLHLPIWSTGNYGSFRHPFRRRLAALADRHEVDLVLSGHDHNYQRSHPIRSHDPRDAWQDPSFVRPRGTVYVVTGGGGARLYPRSSLSPQRAYIREFHARHHVVELEVRAERLDLRALADDGEVIDRMSILRSGEAPVPRLLRGDANLDGQLELGDAIRLLDHLFLGPGELLCPGAGVVSRREGRLDLGEAVYLLWYLFLGGPAPVAPFPECGELESLDDRWCVEVGCAAE